jgi:hypothetical protein
MAYGIDTALFVEDGPAIQAARAASARGPARFGHWRMLDFDHRFEVVQQALKAPANDRIDDYPIAL